MLFTFLFDSRIDINVFTCGRALQFEAQDYRVDKGSNVEKVLESIATDLKSKFSGAVWTEENRNVVIAYTSFCGVSALNLKNIPDLINRAYSFDTLALVRIDL